MLLLALLSASEGRSVSPENRGSRSSKLEAGTSSESANSGSANFTPEAWLEPIHLPINAAKVGEAEGDKGDWEKLHCKPFSALMCPVVKEQDH